MNVLSSYLVSRNLSTTRLERFFTTPSEQSVLYHNNQPTKLYSPPRLDVNWVSRKNRAQIFAANQRQRHKEFNLRGSLTGQKFPLKLQMSPTRAGAPRRRASLRRLQRVVSSNHFLWFGSSHSPPAPYLINCYLKWKTRISWTANKTKNGSRFSLFFFLYLFVSKRKNEEKENDFLFSFFLRLELNWTSILQVW